MLTVRLSGWRAPAISRLVAPAALIVWASFPAQPFAQGLDDIEGMPTTPPEIAADPSGAEDDAAARVLRGSRDTANLRKPQSRAPENTHAIKGGERIDSPPAEAYGANRPVDMMDKAGALPTSPRAQQHRKNLITRISAA